MKINRREHPTDQAAKEVEYFRKRWHLFAVMDRVGDTAKLVTDTLSEVHETKEELDTTTGYKPELAAGEWTDSLNVLVALNLYLNGPDSKPSEYLYGVNGEGKHSNIFEKLIEVIQDIEDDPQAIREAFQLLWSLGIHQIFSNPLVIFAEIDKAFKKIKSNYPHTYHSGRDPLTGDVLSDEVAREAFTHFTKALKMIRKRVKRTLKPEDYTIHHANIANFRNSQAELAQLQYMLDLQPDVQSGVAVLGSSIKTPSPETTILINRTKNNGILYSAS